MHGVKWNWVQWNPRQVVLRSLSECAFERFSHRIWFEHSHFSAFAFLAFTFLPFAFLLGRIHVFEGCVVPKAILINRAMFFWRLCGAQGHADAQGYDFWKVMWWPSHSDTQGHVFFNVLGCPKPFWCTGQCFLRFCGAQGHSDAQGHVLLKVNCKNIHNNCITTMYKISENISLKIVIRSSNNYYTNRYTSRYTHFKIYLVYHMLYKSLYVFLGFLFITNLITF